MTRLAISAVAALVLPTGQALAHTGDHSALSISGMGAHLASWPDHLAITLTAAFGVLIALGARRLGAVKRRR